MFPTNRAELREFVLLIMGRLLKWSTVSSLTQNFGGLNATMPPIDPQLGDQSTTQTCRNMIGFGVRSAPVSGSECIVSAPRGGPVNATIVASDHLGYGPTDLEEGETVLFSVAHHSGEVCFLKLNKDGDIVLVPKGGRKVKLGDDVDANLDPVALYTQLKADYDNFVSTYNGHSHILNGIQLGAGSKTSEVPGSLANNLSTSVRASNVVAKKP